MSFHRAGRTLGASRGVIAALLAAAAAIASPASAAELGTAVIGGLRTVLSEGVSEDDLKVVPPPPNGMANALIFGYAHRWKNGPPPHVRDRVTEPVFKVFDSDRPEWWDEQLDEALFARPRVILPIARSCRDPEDPNSAGPGGMCPNRLRMLVEAIDRLGAERAVKLAPFVDTAALFALRRELTRAGPERLDEARSNNLAPLTRFDLSATPDSAGHDAFWYFWNASLRPWFDAVPRRLWYTLGEGKEERVLVGFWGIEHRFTNHAGNTTRLLEAMRRAFQERYGISPTFLVSTNWLKSDPQLAERPDLIAGVHAWFNPRHGSPQSPAAVHRWDGKAFRPQGKPDGLSSRTAWGGRTWGVTVPAFNCGPKCNVPALGREGGQSFATVLEANRDTALNLVEGFNGPLEGTAAFRSRDPQWQTPNQYLLLLRRFGDPQSLYTRFQAEGGDRVEGAGRGGSTAFAGSTGVTPLSPGAPVAGWGVDAKGSDGFVYEKVWFAAGRYRVITRLQPANDIELALVVNGKTLARREVKRGGSDPIAVHLGDVEIGAGEHQIELRVLRGEAVLDWMSTRRL